MKLVSIEFSQVLRLASFFRRAGGLYFPDALRKIHDRYGFMESPQNLNELDETKGIHFHHGKFKDTSITRFGVYRNGILAEGVSDIETIDEFISDVIEWAQKELGIEELDVTPVQTAFDSQLVVQADIEFDSQFSKISQIGEQINGLLKKYGTTVPQYQFAGFSLFSDFAEQVGTSPSAFRFERRAGQPFERKLYYSTAPLMTQDHLAVLEIIEKTL